VNKLIVFEGVDASGKSTQIKLLEEKLFNKSINFSTFREPGGNILSEKIRDLLLDKNIEICNEAELMLFLASRAQNTVHGVLKELKNDKIVICDRYADSTLAYQGFGKGIDKEFINSCNAYVTNGLVPAVTIILDIERSKSKYRDKSDGDRMEKNSNSFFLRVSNGYRYLCEKYPDRYFLIDGMQSIETVHSLIWNKIKREFEI